jgi:hypothetical protein
MRRFQWAKNRRNPITGCGEIDRRRSTLARVCFWDGDFPVSPSKYIHFFAWFGVDHTIFKHFFIFSEMHNVNFEVEIYMLYAIAICYFILYYLIFSCLVFSCLILSYLIAIAIASFDIIRIKLQIKLSCVTFIVY